MAKAQPAVGAGSTAGPDREHHLLTMLVHNLRSPLTGVLAPLEMLRDGDLGPLTDAQRAALDEMTARGEELAALIDDLLRIRGIESGALPLRLELCTAGDLLSDVQREWAFRMAQAGARFEVHDAGVVTPVRADRAVLRRVFGNLLDNALACGGPGTHVAVSANQTPEGVAFVVADDGPGIRPEFHDVIFRPFERVRDAGVARRRGWGLGLAFCRLAVEAHGGRIRVVSDEGQGSAFQVLLPPAGEAGGRPGDA